MFLKNTLNLKTLFFIFSIIFIFFSCENSSVNISNDSYNKISFEADLIQCEENDSTKYDMDQNDIFPTDYTVYDRDILSDTDVYEYDSDKLTDKNEETPDNYIENMYCSIQYGYSSAKNEKSGLFSCPQGYFLSELSFPERKVSISEYVMETSLRGGFQGHGHVIKVRLSIPFNTKFPTEVKVDNSKNFIRLYAESLSFLHLISTAVGTVTVESFNSSLTTIEELYFKSDNIEMIDNPE